MILLDRRASWRVRPGAPAPGTALCKAAALAEGKAMGLVFGGGSARFELVLLRHGGRAMAYVNDCPHARTTLDMLPDQFFNREGTHLLCRTHGAEFRINDGVCVRGPCLGKALEPVPVEERDGSIIVAET
jgi:nitrite reductase/ring-hydroxylating ferredoxin subunit